MPERIPDFWHLQAGTGRNLRSAMQNLKTGTIIREKTAENEFRDVPFIDDLFDIFIKLQTSLKAEQNIGFTPGLLQNKAEGIRNTNNTTENSSRKKMAADLYRKMKRFTDDLSHDLFRIFIKLQTSLKAEQNIGLTPG